jgi:hypothetical protein
MIKAVTGSGEYEMGFLKFERQFNLPRTTLFHFIQRKVFNLEKQQQQN